MLLTRSVLRVGRRLLNVVDNILSVSCRSSVPETAVICVSSSFLGIGHGIQCEESHPMVPVLQMIRKELCQTHPCMRLTRKLIINSLMLA